MQAQMAAVYKVNDFYLVHSLMRVPDGFWVAHPPFERIDDLAVHGERLGQVAKDALDRSEQLPINPAPTEPQDTELLQAAGFKSRKRFFESATTCTLRRAADGGGIIRVRGSVKADKGSHWIPDRDVVEVDNAMTGELGQVIKSLLFR
jgi:hypothetical protein